MDYRIFNVRRLCYLSARHLVYSLIPGTVVQSAQNWTPRIIRGRDGGSGGGGGGGRGGKA